MKTCQYRNESTPPLRQQLELSFDSSATFQSRITQRQRRLSRAEWWFAQMRAVVNRALDWSPAPTPPPQQVSLALSRSR